MPFSVVCKCTMKCQLALWGPLISSYLFVFLGMSEVSLEAESRKTSAEDPQLDSEEDADKAEESLSEDVKEEESVDNSRGGDGRDEVLYDIDIDSAEENAENSDSDVQKEDEGIQSGSVVTCSDSDAAHMPDSVENGKHETNHHVETAETPEESGDSHTETKVIFTFTLDNQPLLAFPYCALVHLAVWISNCCYGGGLFPV